jgi:hypothetical protein
VAGVDPGRKLYPAKYPQRPRRETWKPATGIPHRATHREQVRQLLEQTHDQRRSMIETAKAALNAA